MQSTDCRLKIKKEIDRENNYFILNRKREPQRQENVSQIKVITEQEGLQIHLKTW